MVVRAQAAHAISPSMRFESLDALRGLCALAVALFHFRSSGWISELPVVRNGRLFVDYFFVLSGFVIAHSYGAKLRERSVSIARFMGLRLGRVYPLHLAVLLAFFALEAALLLFHDILGQFAAREPFTGGRDLASLWQSLLLLHSFGVTDGLVWNGPSWSIAAEVWTYLLFALVFAFARRIEVWVVAALAALSLGVLWADGETLNRTWDLGFVRCVAGFGLGVLAYRLFCRRTMPSGTFWEIAACALAIGFVSFAGLGALTLAAPFVFALTILLLARQRGAVSALLARPTFQWLGLTSYSIYMVHIFVQARLGEFFQLTGLVKVEPGSDGGIEIVAPPLIGDCASVVMLILVVAAASLSYWLVEKPARQLSRRWLIKRAPGGGAPHGNILGS